MRELTMPDGDGLPVLGQGTWGMGEDPGRRESEVGALQHGLDRGLALIDTAEMYGRGGAEEVVGRAVAGRREEAFLVSKVLPSNAGHRDVLRACERSLQRLGTEYLDLYLLHWRGATPLAETLEAFAELREQGKIRRFGVSNFDPDDMAELVEHDLGRQVVTDQVLYNLTRRGVEVDLLPWCAQRGVPVMAYSPIEQGRLLHDAALGAVAERHGVEPAQVALAWALRGGVCAIPKASDPRHVDANLAALDVELDSRDVSELDAAFPAPDGPVPLEIL
ncbi:aldo/keto reductase [Saccharopolyspora sp. HNM0983]|uniref:Aldo/keto reductase n=1 Tax=Saccharopolyspora montiporae TaxID=2781240 RepID=A0A929BD98_9PSEU|nr:aldo/keto reductase [Saccharopolyspora sp. HNM0983]MBE9375926.1 aldo/keto reductase [Saccharopolyspora sp. HNM0983]